MGRYLRWEAREGPRATWRESLRSVISLVLGTYRDTIAFGCGGPIRTENTIA